MNAKPRRAAGEGRYVLVQHGDHSHLAYTLELLKELKVEEGKWD